MTSEGQTGRGEAWVITQIILLGIIVVVALIDVRLPEAIRPLSRAAGVIIAGAGLLLALISLLYLGGNLSIFPKPLDNNTLVDTGIYGLVRHPIYSGVILSALGWSLFWSSIPALAITLVLGAFFDRKAAHEERMLEQKHPSYGEYRKRVRKLIPWIY